MRDFSQSLRLERLLGDRSELVEALDVLVGHLREHLTIELDTGDLEAVHELGVRDVVHTSGSVDAGDPETTDVALLVATITILVLERVLHLLLGVLVRTRGSA